MARLTPGRNWIGTPLGVVLCASVASLALVTLTVVWPERPRREYERRQPALEREAEQAARYALLAQLAARRVVLRDSLLALKVEGVQIRLDPTLDRGMRDSMELRLRQAWSGFALPSTRVPVLIVGWRHRPEKEEAGQVGPFTVLPISAGQPCLVVVTSASVRRDSLAADARLLRSLMHGCSLFARHGLPGAAVRQELRRVGWRPVPLVINRMSWYLYREVDRSLLVSARYSPRAVWTQYACLAGRDRSCETAAGDRTASALERGRELPPQLATQRHYWGFFYGGDNSASLLASLEAGLAPRSFAALWADDRTFPDAVRAHTGRPLGAWYRDLLLRHQAPLVGVFSSNGPLFVRAAFFLMLAAVVSVAAHRRRVVTST